MSAIDVKRLRALQARILPGRWPVERRKRGHTIAELIAVARNALPALLDTYEERGRLRSALEKADAVAMLSCSHIDPDRDSMSEREADMFAALIRIDTIICNALHANGREMHRDT